MDTEATIQSLKNQVQDFCEKRAWDQFHNQKELAIGISTEANELLALFRFKTADEMHELMQGDKLQKIENELADTFFFILRFAQMNGIDLSSALTRKIELNNERYPIEIIRGRNCKYDEI